MKGRVFSIEEFSTFDGPGIRMSIFLKGCPLSCSWCHNPEGQRFDEEYMRSPNGCLKCGACEKVGEIKNGRLQLTEKSISACPRSLVRKCSDDYTAEELVGKILKNADILNATGGGVTFSGGEPLAQYKFVLECFDLLEGKLNRAVQTCGYCSEEVFEKVLQKADYFLYDLKVMDEEKHKRYCGVSNSLIKRNYISLVKSGKPFVTRIPLIPGVTDTDENLEDIAKFISGLNVKYVEVLPYNKLAGSKYATVLRDYTPDFDDRKEINLGKEIFDRYQVVSKKM